MKRLILAMIFVLKLAVAEGDVIFFPIQYSVFNYSAEFIYSKESIRKPKSTNSLWAGIGCVGSFLYPEYPTLGTELAIERRRYFKSDTYHGGFISAYAGLALMTNFSDIADLGFVPGLKINYKAKISEDMVLEPYLGISVPVTYSLRDSEFWFPFPLLTVGVRLGFCKLADAT